MTDTRIRPSRETLGERMTTHGHARGGVRTKTYRCWANMRTRIGNSRVEKYAIYGGRGIRCCARWASFAAFLADMGECPEGLTLERTDTNGDYAPGNCHWAAPTEQRRNQRRSKRVRCSDGRLFRSPADAADAVSGKSKSVCDALAGKQRGYKGFTWSWADD